MTDSLFQLWEHEIKELKLVPSGKGRFEVTLNGELIFSKKALGRHAEPNEITNLVRQRLEKATTA